MLSLHSVLMLAVSNQKSVDVSRFSGSQKKV